MPLLNYTTTIKATKTASEMQTKLAKAGAHHVSLSYEQGDPTGLTFVIDTAHGMRSYSLPIDAPAVKKVLEKQGVPFKYRSLEQAERVAWRILKDWLEAQLAIVETQMVTLDQVMLSYMTAPDGRTVYDLYLDQQLALGTGDAL